MNTYELRKAEQEEVMKIQATMTDGNYMEVLSQIDAVHEKYRVMRKENLILTSWSFPVEEWAKLSEEAKIVIVNMATEADRYEQLREDLQGWLEEAP